MLSRHSRQPCVSKSSVRSSLSTHPRTSHDHDALGGARTPFLTSVVSSSGWPCCTRVVLNLTCRPGGSKWYISLWETDAGSVHCHWFACLVKYWLSNCAFEYVRVWLVKTPRILYLCVSETKREWNVCVHDAKLTVFEIFSPHKRPGTDCYSLLGWDCKVQTTMKVSGLGPHGNFGRFLARSSLVESCVFSSVQNWTCMYRKYTEPSLQI